MLISIHFVQVRDDFVTEHVPGGRARPCARRPAEGPSLRARLRRARPAGPPFVGALSRGRKPVKLCLAAGWLVLLIALFSTALVRGAEKIPGQSYFSTARYLEYVAGDLPIVVTVPHGGRLTPEALPKRTKGITGMDGNTQELARALAEELHRQTRGQAHVVFSLLHRSRLDPNREIKEAAQGDAGAELAWREFHAAIEGALAAAVARHGFAFLIDLHGHGHPTARLELGYTLGARSLNQSDADFDALGLIGVSTLRDLHAARGGSAAVLLRGPRSLGALLAERGLRAVPSPQEPGPGDNPFFSGGYIVKTHAAAPATTKIDGVQIECPRPGVRDTAENRARFARITAEALLAFLREQYAYEPAAKQ